jgi:uncharacterized damage-inducible protein DinB
MIPDFAGEYRRYRMVGERALRQLSDDTLNVVSAADGNSPAMIVRHISGNFESRFTDFLTSDGEKPWRDRDDEFHERRYTRREVDTLWANGWGLLEDTLRSLQPEDLARTVTIRSQHLSVHAALCRSLAHVAYHVGQLVLMARQTGADPWEWISIPKGESRTYNAAQGESLH